MSAEHVLATATPAPHTGSPLHLLLDCHARTASHLRTLNQLAHYIALRGCDLFAQMAARRILRFFDTEVPLHRLIEEEELFPALLESMAGSDAICLREMTEGFTREHHALTRLWRQIHSTLETVARGTSTPWPASEVEAFVQLARRHLDAKDKELIPMAERLIPDEELARINLYAGKTLGALV